MFFGTDRNIVQKMGIFRFLGRHQRWKLVMDFLTLKGEKAKHDYSPDGKYRQFVERFSERG